LSATYAGDTLLPLTLRPMRYIYTLCSFYIALGALSVLCAGCKGPMAHDDPASNAPTTKERSAETPSTELHYTRTNSTKHLSPAGSDSNAVNRRNRVSSNGPDVVSETDIIFPGNISFIQTSFFSEIEETEDDVVVQEDVIPLDRSHVLNETGEIFSDTTSHVSATAESEYSMVVQGDVTPSDQSHVVAEAAKASSDDSPLISEIEEIKNDGGNQGNGPDSGHNLSMQLWTLPLYALYNLPTHDDHDSDPNLSTHTWPLLGNKTPYNTPRRPLQTGPSILHRTSHSMSQADISYLLGQSFNASRADDRQPN
jgi:hypothetical protein